jgi:EamA domain-containing membrane protein RarD
VAVVIFGETLTIERITSFVIIWLAIGLYLFDLFRERHSMKMALDDGIVGD